MTAVLFTDIVGSTDTAARLGGPHWRAARPLERMVAAEVERLRGRLTKTTGDGAPATFHGPAEPIRSAFALRDCARTPDLQLRQGIHIGEVERRGNDIGRDRGEPCRARAGDGETG